MGVFTALDDPELATLAAAFGLGAVGGCRPIAAGTINSNFEVTTASGAYFVRINEGKAELDVAWEARLVAALADAGVATPAPLVAADGRPYAPLGSALHKWVSVFPWRAGGHLDADEVTDHHAAQLGAALARLHVAGLALPPAWRRGSIYDHDHLVSRYDRLALISDPQLAHAIAILGEELATITDGGALRRRATHGMIHGDLFRDNVLWANASVAAILDFEQASGGSLAYDLAVCINDWCWDPCTAAPRCALASALLAGYENIRPLPDGDRLALPLEVRAAAARFTITRITDVYLARVRNPEKDFRAFLARVEAWRGPALGQLTSAL